MGKLTIHYFKTVSYIFVGLLLVYIFVTDFIFDSPINIWSGAIRALIPALLLPLFSKKYIAAISSEAEINRFAKTRKKLFILVGIALSVGVLAFFFSYLSLK